MRPKWRHGGALGLGALLIFGSWGCREAAHDDLPRQAISGTVTFDGKPLKSGFIQFHPASETEGMSAGGKIVDGRFDVPQDEGPVPGSYKVQINSLEPTPPAPPPPAENEEDLMPGAIQVPARRALPGRPIPPRYNSQSELTAVVSADKANTYKFDLEK